MRLREHLTLSNLYLQHSERDVFVTSKCRSSFPYFCWRMFWALYHSSWLMGNIIVTCLEPDVSVPKWFIYLSNWVHVLLTLECVVEVTVVVGLVYGRSETPRDEDSPGPQTYDVKFDFLGKPVGKTIAGKSTLNPEISDSPGPMAYNVTQFPRRCAHPIGPSVSSRHTPNKYMGMKNTTLIPKQPSNFPTAPLLG